MASDKKSLSSRLDQVRVRTYAETVLLIVLRLVILTVLKISKFV